MEQAKEKKLSALKGLADKTYEEKVEYLNASVKQGLLSSDDAAKLLEKISSRKKLKENQLKAIKSAEKENLTTERSTGTTAREEVRMTLENLRNRLRLKRKAYLTDRYFNPELSPVEKRALTFALTATTYDQFSYAVGGVLVEVLKYPIKEVKMQGNKFMEFLLNCRDFDFLLWGRILGKKYVAKRQWQQMINYSSLFEPYLMVYSSAIKTFMKNGDKGAEMVYKALLN